MQGINVYLFNTFLGIKMKKYHYSNDTNCNFNIDWLWNSNECKFTKIILSSYYWIQIHIYLQFVLFQVSKRILQIFSIHLDKINENYLKIQRIKKSFFAPSFLENFWSILLGFDLYLFKIKTKILTKSKTFLFACLNPITIYIYIILRLHI